MRLRTIFWMHGLVLASCGPTETDGGDLPSDFDTGLATGRPDSLDDRLSAVLDLQQVAVAPLTRLPVASQALVDLGELLFYDPILSGNRDMACATCHRAAQHTSDGLVLSLGTGVVEVGPDREEADHGAHLQRRAPFLWNRGRMDVLFWDGRVDGSTGSVAHGLQLPAGTWDDPLAVQATHPLANPQEMRGAPGDVDVFGVDNELASGSPLEMWVALIARLKAIPEYADGFQDVAGPSWGVEDVAAALAAFQRARFDPADTPWDRYLRGDNSALRDDAKLGAVQFYAEERCSSCHSGDLLTDQRMHNIGVPLVEPVDRGRVERTDASDDLFGFRTPPLRNVALGGPYFHNGTMPDLSAVLKHYGDPEATVSAPPEDALPADLQWADDAAQRDALLTSLSPDLPTVATGASLVGLSNLRAFLEALTDEQVVEISKQVPESVPSGLRVGGGGPPAP